MRKLALVAGVLAFGGLAACVPVSPEPVSGGAERDLARYVTLPHYRAFAVSGGAFGSDSYASGWSSAASWIDGPIEVAVNECNQRRDPSTQPECVLHAIGDIVVAGADADRLRRAKCVYILDPAATSADGPLGASCAAAESNELILSAETDDPAARVALSVDEVRSQIVGNTLARKSSAYIHVRSDGTAVLRSADAVVGPDTGSWRLDEAGNYCAWWGKVGQDREVCGPIIRRGSVYEFANSEFSVIKGKPVRALAVWLRNVVGDKARWAVEEYAWRFDGLERAPQAGGAA
jgi:hypothetical protein